jgi:hypothetical protein
METAHDEKIVIVALLASGLVACAQPQAPKEDSRLKEAYSACINTAEGSPEKIEACQSVLNVLKKEKAHEQFATQENVRVMDYQACIQARKTGNDQEVAKRCDQIWNEIRNNNKSAVLTPGSTALTGLFLCQITKKSQPFGWLRV